MSRCRNILIAAVTVLLFVGSGLTAKAQYFETKRGVGTAPQMREIGPELNFEGISMSWVGDRHLEISFRVHVVGKVVGHDEALHIVPSYEEAGATFTFPIVLINDPTRNSYYRRETALLDREVYVSQRPAQVVVLEGKRTDEWVTYRQMLTLPSDITRQGEVKIYQFIQSCCDLHQVGEYDAGRVTAKRHLREGEQTPPEAKPSLPEAKPQLPAPEIRESDVRFYRPKREVVKERRENHTVRIQFRVGKWDILPDYAGNYRELQQVEEVMRPLLRGADVTLLSASISGYASPEATEAFNLDLSRKRAISFRSYLQSRYGLSLANFPARGMGEDWVGLRRAVEQDYNVPNRWTVLSVIDNVYDLDRREAEIKRLAGMSAYRYLLDVLYPPLRRMEMELQYKVRDYSTEEAEQLIDSRPQELSQEEIYRVAERHRDGSDRKSYGKEFDIAAQYFSEDLIANLNASSAALVRGDYPLAWQYLSRIKEEPLAYNNLGLYYWGIGDGAKAEDYLRRATRVRDTRDEASRNLKRLHAAMKQMR